VPGQIPDEESEVLELLGKEYVRAILAATSREAMAAKELSEDLDADLSTIYRHADNMVDHDLLVERTRIVEDGSHHSVYEANVDHVDVDVGDGTITISVRLRESAAERFSRIWGDIRES
jgi:hypothetical protein